MHAARSSLCRSRTLIVNELSMLYQEPCADDRDLTARSLVGGPFKQDDHLQSSRIIHRPLPSGPDSDDPSQSGTVFM